MVASAGARGQYRRQIELALDIGGKEKALSISSRIEPTPKVASLAASGALESLLFNKSSYDRPPDVFHLLRLSEEFVGFSWIR